MSIDWEGMDDRALAAFRPDCKTDWCLCSCGSPAVLSCLQALCTLPSPWLSILACATGLGNWQDFSFHSPRQCCARQRLLVAAVLSWQSVELHNLLSSQPLNSPLQCSAVQFSSERPMCAPPGLPEVSPGLPLKWFPAWVWFTVTCARP